LFCIFGETQTFITEKYNTTMNIQAEKAKIIEQFKQVNDENLIIAIKNILDYALKKEQESLEIPEAHQKLVIERFDKVREDPERLLDWDKAKKTLKSVPLHGSFLY
jgi:hypothetical protein